MKIKTVILVSFPLRFIKRKKDHLLWQACLYQQHACTRPHACTRSWHVVFHWALAEAFSSCPSRIRSRNVLICRWKFFPLTSKASKTCIIRRIILHFTFTNVSIKNYSDKFKVQNTNNWTPVAMTLFNPISGFPCRRPYNIIIRRDISLFHWSRFLYTVLLASRAMKHDNWINTHPETLSRLVVDTVITSFGLMVRERRGDQMADLEIQKGHGPQRSQKAHNRLFW